MKYNMYLILIFALCILLERSDFINVTNIKLIILAYYCNVYIFNLRT